MQNLLKTGEENRNSKQNRDLKERMGKESRKKAERIASLFEERINFQLNLMINYIEKRSNQKFKNRIDVKVSELVDDGNNDKEAERRPVWKKLSGMVIPGIITNRGDLKVNY